METEVFNIGPNGNWPYLTWDSKKVPCVYVLRYRKILCMVILIYVMDANPSYNTFNTTLNTHIIFVDQVKCNIKTIKLV